MANVSCCTNSGDAEIALEQVMREEDCLGRESRESEKFTGERSAQSGFCE